MFDLKKGMPAKAGSLDYAVGDTVRHIKFGVGIVEKIEDGGRDYEVTVNFGKMRRQKNVCCFCKIKEIIKKKNYSDFYSIFTEKVIYLSEKERCLSEGRQERTCAYEQTG